VIPTMVVRDGDRILAHGSTGSRWMRRLASGGAIGRRVPGWRGARGASRAVCFTAYDGVGVARSGGESSIRYRSAVVFGRCTPVTEDKERFLDLVTEALIPGRSVEVRRPTKAELAATLVLGLPLDDWSLKISASWPEDEDDDVAGPAWAGVVPVHESYAAPLAA